MPMTHLYCPTCEAEYSAEYELRHGHGSKPWLVATGYVEDKECECALPDLDKAVLDAVLADAFEYFEG